MTAHIALLRAVNLGSHNKVGMADLRACLERQGFVGVRTLLQSGNVVLGGGRCAAPPWSGVWRRPRGRRSVWTRLHRENAGRVGRAGRRESVSAGSRGRPRAPAPVLSQGAHPRPTPRAVSARW